MTITNEPKVRQYGNVEQTVRDALAAEGLTAYVETHAQGVIKALREREQAIFEELTERAVDLGLDEGRAHDLLWDAGLGERPQPPAPEPVQATTPNTPGDEADLMETLRSINTELQRIAPTIDSLANFARRYGWRG